MQSGNHETYIRKYNYFDSLSCYEKIKQNILTKLKEIYSRLIYLKKNVGFWQFGDGLFLAVYVPLLFAGIVDIYVYVC